MSIIASVSGRVISDSRGQPTVEVTITDDQGRIGTASLPAGSSVSHYEAAMVPAQDAVTLINTTIAPSLLRLSLDSQITIDQRLQALDPTPNRSQIGVNSTLGISLACARLLASAQDIPLYTYIQRISNTPAITLPIPMFNLINGGKHAQNNLDFQEYMVIPVSMQAFHEKLEAGKKIFAELGKILYQTNHDTSIGYEGGYAPNLDTNEEGLGFLVQAIEAAGYVPGVDVMLGLDIAASALSPTYAATVDSYMSLFENFPLFSIEDPFQEDDWEGWSNFKQRLDQLAHSGRPYLLVGDDLFVGNKDRLLEGIQRYVANAVLIKINQAATLSEIIEAITIAKQYNAVHILSHRSGETLDSFVSDLAIGTGASFIKAGSPNEQSPERIIKYERIVEVEEELNVANPN